MFLFRQYLSNDLWAGNPVYRLMSGECEESDVVTLIYQKINLNMMSPEVNIPHKNIPHLYTDTTSLRNVPIRPHKNICDGHYATTGDV